MVFKVNTQLSEVQRKVQPNPITRRSERETNAREMAGSQKRNSEATRVWCLIRNKRDWTPKMPV